MEGKRKGSAKKKALQVEEEIDTAFVDKMKKRATVTTHGIDNVNTKPLINPRPRRLSTQLASKRRQAALTRPLSRISSSTATSRCSRSTRKR